MTEYETQILSLVEAGKNANEILSALGFDPQGMPDDYKMLASAFVTVIATLTGRMDGLDAKMDSMLKTLSELRTMVENS